VLRTIDDPDLGVAVRAEARVGATGPGLQMFSHVDQVCEAIALGRSGEAVAASELGARAHESLLGMSIGGGILHATWLFVAGAAIRDGWGDPAGWLRHGEAWFAERRLDLMVRRSRALLVEAGAPVSRRGRGDSQVPTGLRALGVTSREVDVLKLVMAGRTNREIAAELYLSPKTVERHIGSLFDRTGVRNRQALADLGAGHLG
jgi:DNA-binding CsgD family transcriptional regulator